MPQPSTALRLQLALRYAAWGADSHLARLPRSLLLCVCDYLLCIAITDLANCYAISYVDSAAALLATATQVCCVLTLKSAVGASLAARLHCKRTDARGYCSNDYGGMLSLDHATCDVFNLELTDGWLSVR